jgi:hypothetical protein
LRKSVWLSATQRLSGPAYLSHRMQWGVSTGQAWRTDCLPLLKQPRGDEWHSYRRRCSKQKGDEKGVGGVLDIPFQGLYAETHCGFRKEMTSFRRDSILIFSKALSTAIHFFTFAGSASCRKTSSFVPFPFLKTIVVVVPIKLKNRISAGIN